MVISRLKFTGVTITDALRAGALQAFGSIRNRALLAARAGMDLVLCVSPNANQGTVVVGALARAVKSGKLQRSAFMAAVQRVLALRAELGP